MQRLILGIQLLGLYILIQRHSATVLKLKFNSMLINLCFPKRNSMVSSLLTRFVWLSVQFSSVAQSCPTLCDPINRSTWDLPVHHKLLEFIQTHAHRVSDAIQPSHPLSSPSPPAPNPPSIRVFSNESTLHMRWPTYWSFSYSISPSNEHPGLISFRIDLLGRNK